MSTRTHTARSVYKHLRERIGADNRAWLRAHPHEVIATEDRTCAHCGLPVEPRRGVMRYAPGDKVVMWRGMSRFVCVVVSSGERWTVVRWPEDGHETETPTADLRGYVEGATAGSGLVGPVGRE